ncbi:MAG: PLP-dependent transferase [Planctomycetes bacterium]|nr:PLP-dependent transferase [Planctomycetota bacterium]
MKRSHSDGHREFNPETLALGFGYDSDLSEHAVKPPVFLTSTFQFASAREGKRFFELAYGLREQAAGEQRGLIYSRLNNPNLQIYEERMAAWDQTEMGATFATGMAAIATSVLTLVRPGDVVISSSPVYGGTHYLFHHVLAAFGVEVRFVPAGDGCAEAMREVVREVGGERVRVLFVETPANPNLLHTDIAAVTDLARHLAAEHPHATPPVTIVDNTLLGPVFQRPATFGADVVVYSATKFLGGHSDLVAGLATGRADILKRIRDMRTILGTTTTPFNGWLLLRSLETVSVRMRRQAKSATKLAHLLAEHPRVTRVVHPSLLEPGSPQHDVFTRQCTGNGSLISFEVDGGEDAAFAVLDRFEVFRLAVSLGGTESLVEHPMAMTHADVPPEELEKLGVTSGLIRVSVGLEHLSDLKRDLLWALKA